jgi:hypothetical protein
MNLESMNLESVNLESVSPETGNLEPRIAFRNKMGSAVR